MHFLLRIPLVLLFAIAIINARGSVISRAEDKEPRYDLVIKHNVLAIKESFNPIKVAKKTHSDYIVIMSQSDLSKLTKKNTIYHIKSEINLQGKTLLIPQGCLLYFDRGSFRNGTIKGSKTVIVAKDYEVFKRGIRTYRAYKADSYKYLTKDDDVLIIGGSWDNKKCGSNWTGMLSCEDDHCASLSINNFIKLHKPGQEIIFPERHVFFVYGRITCSGYSIDFSNSIIKSIDFDKVEDQTIILPSGTQSRPLKSLYGLLDFNGDNSYLKNLTIDGRASKRNELPSLGTECLLSMASNHNCMLKNIKIENAVGCGICTYAISDCTFDNVTINGCGEHGLYTHAYEGTLIFNNCNFINCGQDVSLFKQRGASACVNFSGARDRGYAALSGLKAYFRNCIFESFSSSHYVATFYSNIPYAEFYRCQWKGVKGYSIVSPKLAEQIGRLVEFKFIECDNPCYSIQSVNTIRRLIRCKNVTNPFSDTIELTDCEINVGYADIVNNYSTQFVNQYNTPLICTNCSFIKGPNDTPIRNTIINPRPMFFKHCKWLFENSNANQYRGSHFIVLSDSNFSSSVKEKSVVFSNCDINIDKYRLLYCSDTHIEFKDCNYITSYDTLVDAKKDHPNHVSISNMKNTKKKEIARNSIIINY